MASVGKRTIPTERPQLVDEVSLKVGCLHPVACTKSGSGVRLKMVIRPKHVAVTK
jgi:hypothetical protein